MCSRTVVALRESANPYSGFHQLSPRRPGSFALGSQQVNPTRDLWNQHASFSSSGAAECNEGGSCLGFLAELTG